MWLDANDFVEMVAPGGDRGPSQAEASEGKVDRRGDSAGREEPETFVQIGALAGAIVDKLKSDRATRIAPRGGPVAPAGSVAQAGRRRQIE